MSYSDAAGKMTTDHRVRRAAVRGAAEAELRVCLRAGRLASLCALLGASVGLAGEAQPALRLWTHGGPPGSHQFVVEVTPGRQLAGSNFSRPMTASGLTEAKLAVELAPEQFEELLSLALEATDFTDGCGVVADGTAADLVVHAAARSAERTCAGASQWPLGSKTRSFLATLNGFPPREFHVFQAGAGATIRQGREPA